MAVSFPSLLFAQGQPTGSVTPPPPTGSVTPPSKSSTYPALQNPLKAGNVKDVLFSLVDLAIFIGVILAVLTFIWIGFKFVLAGGDPGAVTDARKWFLWAVVGTAILISSKVIVEVIKNTLTSTGVVNEKIFK